MVADVRAAGVPPAQFALMSIVAHPQMVVNHFSPPRCATARQDAMCFPKAYTAGSRVTIAVTPSWYTGGMSMPDYSWFDQAPGHYMTRNQPAELGLKPGGPIVATVTWKRGKRYAYLFDQNAAVPKRQLSEAQQAALKKAREAADLKAHTCYRCGRLSPFRLERRERCEQCVGEAFERMRARDRKHAALWANDVLSSPGVLLLDTETTSLGGYIVQLGVVALDGAVLLNSLVNPQSPIDPQAEAIHGISQAMVERAPTFAALVDRLASLLHGHRVVAYNASFDAGVFEREIARLHADAEQPWKLGDDWSRQIRWEDAMEQWSAFCGEWSNYHKDYRWQPLMGAGHDAVGDCLARLHILRIMAAEATADAAETLPLPLVLPTRDAS